MKFISTYKRELAVIIITAIICIALFAGWNSWFREPMDVTEHAAEIRQLTEELKLSKAEKAEDFAAYQDSMDAYRNIPPLDTHLYHEISNRYNEKKQDRALISPDSSAVLLRERLRQEHQYATRFDYSILPN